MGHKPAGGPLSRQVVSKPVKTGPGARGVNIKWPAQVGLSRGNRVQGGVEGGRGGLLPLSGVRADPYKPPNFNPVRQGNEIAAATVCRPGGSREILKSGSQQGLVTRANNPRGHSFDV
jgi:hypothetical protein